MPTYEFRCTECGHKFTERVSIDDRDKITCPKCDGQVKQIFSTLDFLRTYCGGGSSGFG